MKKWHASVWWRRHDAARRRGATQDVREHDAKEGDVCRYDEES
jgi:hypothetical protein